MNPRRTLTTLDTIALALATIGAINWGLSGAANFNLVRRIFGRGSFLERAVYIVVGLAGLDLAWLTARFITGGYQTPTGPVSGQMMQQAQQPGSYPPSGYQPGTYPPSGSQTGTYPPSSYPGSSSR